MQKKKQHDVCYLYDIENHSKITIKVDKINAQIKKFLSEKKRKTDKNLGSSLNVPDVVYFVSVYHTNTKFDNLTKI